MRLLAAIIAVTIANLYYAQPLLHTLAGAFGLSDTIAGLIVTAAQVGYAVGLIFVVPLGDIVRRRPLMVGLLGVDAVALAASALAPGLRVFAALALLVGVASVVVQMIVPYAATLASDDQRAGVIGTLMGGLLVGILGARAFAGVLAGLAGWRAVYVVAAGLMAVTAAVVRRWLPDSPPALSITYRAQLRGIVAVVGGQPVLRWRAVIGACAFAAFTCFWTTVTFLLAGHYHLSELQIGLFALLGAAGALTAVVGGRVLNTRTRLRWPITAGLATVLVVAFGLIYLGGTGLGWLIVGVLVMDAAMQALNVTNQAVVYDLVPQARSRITTVYVTSLFVGSAVGSAIGSQAYGHFGWAGASAAAAGFTAAAVAATLAVRRHEHGPLSKAGARPAPQPHRRRLSVTGRGCSRRLPRRSGGRAGRSSADPGQRSATTASTTPNSRCSP